MNNLKSYCNRHLFHCPLERLVKMVCDFLLAFKIRLRTVLEPFLEVFNKKIFTYLFIYWLTLHSRSIVNFKPWSSRDNIWGCYGKSGLDGAWYYEKITYLQNFYDKIVNSGPKNVFFERIYFTRMSILQKRLTNSTII